MLHLTQLAPDHLQASSHSLPHLAACPDVLARTLAQPGDAMSLHARHHDEQAQTPDGPYAQELELLGPAAAWSRIVQLARPYQPNVVWTDRLHLVGHGADPTIGGRLCGLYVGARGTITLLVYPPAAAAASHALVESLPQVVAADDWLQGARASLCRYAFHYDERNPRAVDMWLPMSEAPSVATALAALQ